MTTNAEAKEAPKKVETVEEALAAAHATTDEVRAANGPTYSGRMPAKRVSDVTGAELWPDRPQVDVKDLIGQELIIIDATELPSQKFNNMFWVILCADAETKSEFTTACGGQVVHNKIAELKSKGLLPIMGSFTMSANKAGTNEYWDLI